MERDSTTAAMAAAGIIRVPPLNDEDDEEVPSMSRRPHSLFEDGTPVTSVVNRDFRGPFSPYLNYSEPLVLGSREGSSPAPNASRMTPSPFVPPPAGCICRERIHTPSSQGHESYNGHELMLTSESSRSYSPSVYPLLSGSFKRRDLSKQTSSEESYAPPVPPPHILTSFAPPGYTSVQQDLPEQDSPILDYIHHDDEEVLSPLDACLEERLREGDGSKGSVGLHDNEDYSARMRLEVRTPNLIFWGSIASKYGYIITRSETGLTVKERLGVKLRELTDSRIYGSGT